MQNQALSIPIVPLCADGYIDIDVCCYYKDNQYQ